jgi:type IX secretion system PorP/SprF family membrane protein
MRKRTQIIIIFIMLFSLAVSGQTNSVSSQYLLNGLLINPAYAGSRGALSTNLSYRKQWLSVKGAPQAQTISAHTMLKNDRVALAFQAQFMSYGYTKTSGVFASYAYHVRAGNGKLSFGLKAGIDMAKTNYSGINLIDNTDPVFTAGPDSYTLPNIGAGVYYYSDKFFAGLSVPWFLSYRKAGDGSKYEVYHSVQNYDMLFSTGALFSFADGFFRIKPSVLLDYSMQKSKPLEIDLNANFIFSDFIWIGGSWRTAEKSLVAILQLQITQQFMLGYSYDYQIGNLHNYSNGTHEIGLRYEFGYKVSASNPRYF